MADIVHESHKMITDIAKVVGRNGWMSAMGTGNKNQGQDVKLGLTKR